jgi:CDP-diacylglycerol---glycerol-3-phosphate 3-phosphatidyltransferase
MISHRVEEWARRIAKRIGEFIGKSGISPNAVTIIGFLLNFPVAYILAQGQTWSWIAGGILMLVAGAFDMLDGGIARATGKTSKFGAFLDSTFDRASEMVVFFGLLMYFFTTRDTNGIYGFVFGFLALCGSVMVSYAKARAEGLQIEMKGVGLLQRPERVIFVAAACIIQPFWDLAVISVLGFLAVGTIYTAGQRIGHAWAEFARQEKALRLQQAQTGVETSAPLVAKEVKKDTPVATANNKETEIETEEPRRLFSFRRAGR